MARSPDAFAPSFGWLAWVPTGLIRSDVKLPPAGRVATITATDGDWTV